MSAPDPRAPAAIRLRQTTRMLFRGLVADTACVLRVDDGEKRLRLGPLAWSVPAGALTLMPAGLALDVENRPPPGGRYRATALLLPDDLPAPRGRFRGGACTAAGAKAAFDRALDLSRGPAPPNVRRHVAVEVLLWLADSGLVLPTGQRSLEERLRRLLAADIARPWTAAEAAVALAVSEPTLRRRLAADGTGFSAVLAEMRLSRALGLLQTTDLPVAAVAAEVGYASASRFARRFGLRFGLPPSAIRRDDRIGAETDRPGALPPAAAR